MIRSRSRWKAVRRSSAASSLSRTACELLAAQGASVSCSIFSLISLTSPLFHFQALSPGTLSNIITHVR